MANPGRPRIYRAPRSTTFYEIRGTESNDSHTSPVGVIYPIFFLATVIIAVALYWYRGQHSAHGIQQLIVTPDYNAAVELVPNITQRLLAQASGSYSPKGAA